MKPDILGPATKRDHMRRSKAHYIRFFFLCLVIDATGHWITTGAPPWSDFGLYLNSFVSSPLLVIGLLLGLVAVGVGSVSYYFAQRDLGQLAPLEEHQDDIIKTLFAVRDWWTEVEAGGGWDNDYYKAKASSERQEILDRAPQIERARHQLDNLLLTAADCANVARYYHDYLHESMDLFSLKHYGPKAFYHLARILEIYRDHDWLMLQAARLLPEPEPPPPPDRSITARMQRIFDEQWEVARLIKENDLKIDQEAESQLARANGDAAARGLIEQTREQMKKHVRDYYDRHSRALIVETLTADEEEEATA